MEQAAQHTGFGPKIGDRNAMSPGRRNGLRLSIAGLRNPVERGPVRRTKQGELDEASLGDMQNNLLYRRAPALVRAERHPFCIYKSWKESGCILV